MRHLSHANTHRTLSTAIALAWFVSAGSTVFAQQKTSSSQATPAGSDRAIATCVSAQVTDVYVPKHGGQFHVVLTRNETAFVKFPPSIQLSRAYLSNAGFKVEVDGNQMKIRGKRGLKHGAKGEFHINEGDLAVLVQMTYEDKPTRFGTIFRVIPLPVEDFARRVAEERAKQEKLRLNGDIRLNEYREGIAKFLSRLDEVRPASPRVALAQTPANGQAIEMRYAAPGDIRAVLTRAFKDDAGYRYLEVFIDNRTSKQVTSESTWLAEGEDEAVPVQVVGLPSVLREQGMVIQVSASRKVRGIVIVPPGVEAQLEALRLQFRGPPGQPNLVAQQIIETWPRLPEHIAKRRRWAKQLAISVRMLGGGFWTDDAAGNDMIASTSMTGLSVRVAKGMHHNFVFEAEAVGGRTGEARFNNTSWQNMQGTIVRAASFGRAQAAGVLRFGSRYIVSTRLGFGVQGTNFNSKFTSSGTTMTGPGDSFEIDGLWIGGAGFDARLGEHWNVGASANFLSTWKANSSLLEAGLHVGYRWSP